MNKLPLIVFLMLAAVFAVLLLSGKDPAKVESVMIGKPVPAFQLQDPFKKGKSFSASDLQGRPAIVNVFASWCVSCQAEQKVLERMGATEKIKIYGLDYKDTPEKLSDWLQKHGNPYTAIGHDHDGRVSIDWGVYGVPETFIVDAKGIIRYKHIGVITEDDYQHIFKPLLAELRQ